MCGCSVGARANVHTKRVPQILNAQMKFAEAVPAWQRIVGLAQVRAKEQPKHLAGAIGNLGVAFKVPSHTRHDHQGLT